MKRCNSLIAMICAVAVLFPLAGRVQARTQPGMGTATVLETFRLQISGSPETGTTFWVAYGPLAGHFGVIQLHRSAAGKYVAQQRLPARGRTVFAYLGGQGVMQTRLGVAPGNPVITIRRIGPVTLSSAQRSLPVVQWYAPVG